MRRRVGRWRRRCLVANRAILPQKCPPPPQNVAYSCELTETKTNGAFYFSVLGGLKDLDLSLDIHAPPRHRLHLRLQHRDTVRILDGPASGGKGSKGRNQLDCIRDNAGPHGGRATRTVCTTSMRLHAAVRHRLHLRLQHRDTSVLSHRTDSFNRFSKVNSPKNASTYFHYSLL